MTQSEATNEAASKPNKLKIAALGAVGLGLVLQLVPNPAAVERNPEKRASLDEEPAEVVAVLKRSCFDCHSNETEWPLYSRIAPSSWLVHHDVGEGRDFVNFSRWDELDEDEKYFVRESAAEVVGAGEMPPQIYIVPFHMDAKLSDADRALIVKWGEEQE